MIKFVIALMVLFNMAWPVCTKISMPTDYSVVTNGSRANLKANFDETQTKVNPCMDSVDEVRARLTGYTGSFGVYSLENLLLRLDTDASTSAKLVVQNSNGDSLYRVAEDSSARVFGAFRADGAVTLSNYTSGQVPYFGTAGLITSGTGLTYNGSAFSVTGTGAVSGNTTVGGTLGVTGASTLTGAVTVSNTTEATTPSSASVMLSGGLGISKALYSSSYFVSSLTGKNTFILNSTGSDFGYISNPASNTWALGYGTVFTTLGTSALTWNTSGVVSIPGTLAVTGASTLTGAVTHGAGFIDKTTSLTSNTTLTTAHSVIFADASGGSFTLTLPAVSGNTGLTYTIYKTDVTAAATGGGNTVTIDGNGSETIGGDLTQVLASNTGNGVLRIVCTGSKWVIQELRDEGAFISTIATGLTTTPTGTSNYSRSGKIVLVDYPSITGTSNLVSMTITGMPSSIRPVTNTQNGFAHVLDNNINTPSIWVINTSGTIDAYPIGESGTLATFGNFTTSGTKGIFSASITYSIK